MTICREIRGYVDVLENVKLSRILVGDGDQTNVPNHDRGHVPKRFMQRKYTQQELVRQNRAFFGVAHGKINFVVRDPSKALNGLIFCIFHVSVTEGRHSDVSPAVKKIFPEK